jgi:integrase
MRAAGRYNCGRNLFLRVRPTPSGGLSRTWEGQFTVNGKTIYPGFGSVDSVTLSKAHEIAAEWRIKCRAGVNPLDERRAIKQAEAARKTFGEVASDLIMVKRPEWRSPVHARQWEQLESQAAPLWAKAVDSITTPDVLAVLKPLWQATPETASRVRGRIEMVLDAAKASGLRSGENPAQWKGNLAHLLPRRPRLAKEHFAAMDYHHVREFIASLRQTETVAASALEFCILCASRSGEVLGAKWDEIDLDAMVWTIPPNKMKSGRAHRVPLSDRALAILEDMAAHRCSDFVFPGRRRNQLGKTCFGSLVPKGATIHGFRSSFRDWSGNETHFAREVCESALAHATGNSVEQAYRRSDALEKRRALMEAWAQFCEPGTRGNVVAMRKG